MLSGCKLPLYFCLFSHVLVGLHMFHIYCTNINSLPRCVICFGLLLYCGIDGNSKEIGILRCLDAYSEMDLRNPWFYQENGIESQLGHVFLMQWYELILRYQPISPDMGTIHLLYGLIQLMFFFSAENGTAPIWRIR